MKKLLFAIMIVGFLLSTQSLPYVKGEYSGNCPTEGRDYEFYPPDTRIVEHTVTFDSVTVFCVKAGNFNSGKITGNTFTVNWHNNGGQIPDISSIAVYKRPTDVKIYFFASLIGKTYSTLKWKTVEETLTKGFNIYYSNSLEGNKVKINKEIIYPIMQRINQSNTYTYKHKNKNQMIVYWLEIIDIYGHSQLYRAENIFAPLTK